MVKMWVATDLHNFNADFISLYNKDELGCAISDMSSNYINIKKLGKVWIAKREINQLGSTIRNQLKIAFLIFSKGGPV